MKVSDCETINSYFNSISVDAYLKNHVSSNTNYMFNIILKSDIINSEFDKNDVIMVDVGAGLCDLEKKLIECKIINKISCIALDQSKNMLSIGKKNLENLDHNINFIIANANQIPLADNTSDITFLINVLPYVENPKETLNEINRVTKVGGKFVTINPIKETHGFWENNFEGINIHFHKNINKTIEEAGFEVLKEQHIKICPIKNLDDIKVTIGNLYLARVVP